ncbi:MAG: hypothetical protein MRZ79_15365 [Bacteroidia bacterium]|nr:hypothetical protein [Bacteroidia bacterium]
MYKKVALTLLVSLLCLSAISQKNFQPGFIIDLKGKKLQGYIDFQNWEITPNKISFKESTNASTINYNPTQIREFQVEGEKYISAKVALEISPVGSVSRLDRNSELKLSEETVFLRVLIEGEKSLYHHKISSSKENFFIKDKGEFKLLVYKEYVLEKEDGAYLKTQNDSYISLLNDYLNDCGNVFRYLQKNKPAYKKTSLIKSFNFYYDCANRTPSLEAPKEKIQFSSTLILGAVLSQVIFRGSSDHYLIGEEFPISTDPTLGATLNIIFPRSRQRWSLRNELFITNHNFTGRVKDSISSSEYTNYDVNFGVTYFKLFTNLRYTFPAEGARAFVNAGISNSLRIDARNERQESFYFFGVEGEREGLAISSLSVHELGLNGGIGLEYKKLSLEGRYELTDGMSASLNLGSQVNRYYLILGYTF